MVRRTAIVAALAVACVTSAFGYWVASGAGSGQAGVASGAAPVTIGASSPAAQLLPTGTATGDLTVTVTNPNAFRVHLNRLALDSTQGTGGFSANATGCALSFAPQTNGGAGWDVAAGTTATLTLAGSLTMGTGAADACQGQTFTVYVAAS